MFSAVVALMTASVDEVTGICHGTTVATNQLLEGKVDRLGFVTTEGFEFLLEIARQSVPDGYGNSYFWVKPPRIVPADLVRTVGGRLDHRGAELRPFDEQGARAAARFLRDRGVTAVGVCFLHAYANPAHEQRMRAVLAEEHPGAVVSISSEVLREYREYERAMTTLVDAAGALGAALVARTAGFDRVLTLDGGGTSTDVSVVLGGEPTLTTEGTVGAFPSKIPMIDVVTVGASIAWLSREGTLKVGPRSAGADPGPLCYRKGGTEPTVTDAHVVLGRIPPGLLGGEVPLDGEAAREGLRQLGAKLGLELEPAATGVLEISAWNQANALRQITVKRGLDVRDFVLVTFGGSGSLLLCRLLEILGLRVAVVPRDPGNLSAFGLLTVDVKNDYVQTAVARHAHLDLAAVASTYGSLEARAAATLDAEGFARASHRYLRSADLRYYGQAFEVRVPVPDGRVDPAVAGATVDAFHDAHERLYGYCFRDRPEQQVEWVNLRVTGVGPIRRPRLREAEPGDGDAARARTGSRPVCFDARRGHLDTPVYARAGLRPGDTVAGPAIVEEYGSTVPLHPGFHADVDRLGNLVVTPEANP